jgi:Flp pilus assembly protein TadD
LSADSKIDMAQRALEAKNPVFASELYEAAAMDLPSHDVQGRAQLLGLAALHAGEEPQRSVSLYLRAQHCYAEAGDRGKAADQAMARGVVLKGMGRREEAKRAFIESIQLAASELSVLGPSGASEGHESFLQTVEEAIARLTYCRDRLADLTRREDRSG